MKLSATHAFNSIVLMVKFGRTSCEDIPPALKNASPVLVNHFILLWSLIARPSMHRCLSIRDYMHCGVTLTVLALIDKHLCIEALAT